MHNYWLKDSFKNYWTFEVAEYQIKMGKPNLPIIAESKVMIDENPDMKVVESLEVEENGKKVWKPVLMIWENIEVIFTDKSFMDEKNQLRLLEINNDCIGILRHYDKSDEYLESWVMYNLNLIDIDLNNNSVGGTFEFHHALYLI